MTVEVGWRAGVLRLVCDDGQRIKVCSLVSTARRTLTKKSRSSLNIIDVLNPDGTHMYMSVIRQKPTQNIVSVYS